MTNWHVNSGRERGAMSHLSDDRVNDILALAARGVPFNEIARRLGVSNTTVSRRVQKARQEKEQRAEADAA